MAASCPVLPPGRTTRPLTHDGDSRLARHVANAILREDSRGARLSKETKDSPRRIDAAVAAVMAVIGPPSWPAPPSRPSTSEDATTPGTPLPWGRSAGPGRVRSASLVSGRWRPTKVRGGPHPNHRPTKERQRRRRRYGSAQGTLEGRRATGVLAPSGGAGATLWPSWSPVVQSVGWTAARLADMVQLGRSGKFLHRACVPKSHYVTP